METHFALPQRADKAGIEGQILVLSQSPVINSVLEFTSGLLCVLNEHRQVIAINDLLLRHFHIEDAKDVLGLRLGEAIQCIHSQEMPGGCGTSEYCSSCGAAVATVVSWAEDRPVTRRCAISIEKNGKQEDLFLQVQCRPLRCEGARFLALFLQDISDRQNWAALERVFFHDISNIVFGLMGSIEALLTEDGEDNRDLTARIHQLCMRLSKEVDMQKVLARRWDATYQPVLREGTIHQVLDEMRSTFRDHPAAKGKSVEIHYGTGDIKFVTDFNLLSRVLHNMLINGLEASGEGDRVTVWIEQAEGLVTFCVGNPASIPPEVQRRVFQRNFSTKEEEGRGLGTYSMKLFGERLLGGKVTFSSSEQEGTLFRFSLPATC